MNLYQRAIKNTLRRTIINKICINSDCGEAMLLLEI